VPAAGRLGALALAGDGERLEVWMAIARRMTQLMRPGGSSDPSPAGYFRMRVKPDLGNTSRADALTRCAALHAVQRSA
jgi:hypothetical protein